jgi:hypothetical protein
LLAPGKVGKHPCDFIDSYFPDSIRPSSTVPICLDLGTNNQQFLDDPLYLGLRQPRLSGPEMTEFMDEFMHEMSVAFPKLLVQFEVGLSFISRIKVLTCHVTGLLHG